MIRSHNTKAGRSVVLAKGSRASEPVAFVESAEGPNSDKWLRALGSAFEAGTYTDAIKLSYRAYEQIVKPRVEDLAIKVHPIQRAWDCRSKRLRCNAGVDCRYTERGLSFSGCRQAELGGLGGIGEQWTSHERSCHYEDNGRFADYFIDL
jgi:hypothetical protein